MHLNVTASDIEEFWRPRLGRVGSFDEFTPDRPATAAAHRTLIDGAVGIDEFGWHEPDYAACRSADGNARHMGGVLAKVENDVAVGEGACGNRLVDFELT